jgi:GntR family transcriptional regulator
MSTRGRPALQDGPRSRGVAGAAVAGSVRDLRPIDRECPLPYYQQLKSALRAAISAGTWQVGVRIPSEAEFCSALSISRTVVRQALGDLEHERLLTRRKGLGTFVSEPKIRERLVQTLTGFHDDMLAQGRVPRTRVVGLQVAPAAAGVASQLGLVTGSEVAQIDRVRAVDDEPIVLVTTYLPTDLVPGIELIDFTDRSLYQTLARVYGLQIYRGRRMLEAVGAPTHVSAQLGIKVGEPILFLRSVTYLANGRAVEYYEAYHRADRTALEVDLVREREH